MLFSHVIHISEFSEICFISALSRRQKRRKALPPTRQFFLSRDSGMSRTGRVEHMKSQGSNLSRQGQYDAPEDSLRWLAVETDRLDPRMNS
jgi:hypothetical protein